MPAAGRHTTIPHESPATAPDKPSPGGEVAERRRGRMRNAGGDLTDGSDYHTYAQVGSAGIPLPSPAATPSLRERAFLL